MQVECDFLWGNFNICKIISKSWIYIKRCTQFYSVEKIDAINPFSQALQCLYYNQDMIFRLKINVNQHFIKTKTLFSMSPRYIRINHCEQSSFFVLRDYELRLVHI